MNMSHANDFDTGELAAYCGELCSVLRRARGIFCLTTVIGMSISAAAGALQSCGSCTFRPIKPGPALGIYTAGLVSENSKVIS